MASAQTDTDPQNERGGTSLPPPLYVVLDANAWIAEWLLYSTAGSALIDLLVRASGKILLPEVVEREMRQGALNGATSAIQKARNELSRLRQLTKADLARTLPEATEIEAAIRNRIEALDGLIVREPFSYEIARTALERVLSHKRPSQKNNEQFRDCCIWEHCKRAGLSTEVHFVTADTAFYQGQSLEGGLARELQGELGESGINLMVHTTVSQLTSVLAPTTPDHDDEDLLLMINVQGLPIIRERLSQAGFEVSGLIEHELVTLRTEDPLLRLGTFRLVYSLTNSPSQEGTRIEPSLTLRGTCAVTLPSREITNVRIETDTLAWFAETGRPIHHTLHHLQVSPPTASTAFVTI